ncbi:hypothetical protein Tco_0694417 [Tanacetum coccineum]
MSGASRIGKQDAIDATIVGMWLIRKRKKLKSNEPENMPYVLEVKTMNLDEVWKEHKLRLKKPEKETKKEGSGIELLLGLIEGFYDQAAYKEFVKTVYALTRERDTLRREQNKRSDAIAFPKEKDEITTQVMAEGEELSKKQGVQESTTRKLRAHVHIKIYCMVFTFKNLTVSHRLSNASPGSQTVSNENRAIRSHLKAHQVGNPLLAFAPTNLHLPRVTTFQQYQVIRTVGRNGKVRTTIALHRLSYQVQLQKKSVNACLSCKKDVP